MADAGFLSAGFTGFGGVNTPIATNNASPGEFAIYTLTVDPQATNVFTATIVNPLTGQTLLSSTLQSNQGASIGGIGNVGALFAGEVGVPGGATNSFDAFDNFQGAIADLVVYNEALDADELAQNVNFFTTTFFVAVPEPSSVTLLVGLLGAFCLRRRR